MVVFKKFMCWSLETGAKIIAWTLIVTFILFLVFGLTLLYFQNFLNRLTPFHVYSVMYCVGVIILNFILLHGVRKKRPSLILPIIILLITSCGEQLQAILFISQAIYEHTEDKSEVLTNSISIFLAFCIAAIEIYLILVLWSLYWQLIEFANKQVNNRCQLI